MFIPEKQYIVSRFLGNIIAQSLLQCLLRLLPEYTIDNPAALLLFFILPIALGITTALVEKRIAKERFGFWIFTLATVLVMVGDTLIRNWIHVEHDKYNRISSFWTQVQFALGFGLPPFMFLACTSFAITRSATRPKASGNS
jgi:phosphoglycerol transferase MdoB-like AlkP superfamily enzyme